MFKKKNIFLEMLKLLSHGSRHFDVAVAPGAKSGIMNANMETSHSGK